MPGAIAITGEAATGNATSRLHPTWNRGGSSVTNRWYLAGAAGGQAEVTPTTTASGIRQTARLYNLNRG